MDFEELMIGFALSYDMVNCPLYWQNFIEAINKTPGRDVSERRLQSQLKKYRAKYLVDRSTPMGRIEFEGEGDYAWFVLRWT